MTPQPRHRMTTERDRMNASSPLATLRTDLLIGGELSRGEGLAEAIIDPASGETLVEIAEASIDQVEAAIAAAQQAFPGWS